MNADSAVTKIALALETFPSARTSEVETSTQSAMRTRTLPIATPYRWRFSRSFTLSVRGSYKVLNVNAQATRSRPFRFRFKFVVDTGVEAGYDAVLQSEVAMPRAPEPASLVVTNAKIATMNAHEPRATALAVRDGRFLAVGDAFDVAPYINERTEQIDAGGRTIVPGLNDSHIHLIRGGLSFNLELRWDGVTSLADALTMLRIQVSRTPPPQWVRVVGGWSAFQFGERRLPTLDEINAIAPETPVFILHLYDRALLNAAALRAVGYDRNTRDPIGGEIQRDSAGKPTGMLIARPNASILYATLGRGPKLAFDDQMNSTRLFMRELNRFGLTSVIDAGGGSQNYPDDYRVFAELHKRGELTVRTAYHLFTQNPDRELVDFSAWTQSTKPYAGDAFYRNNGAGEMLVYSAADFEDFQEAQPVLPAVMESQLYDVARLLVEKRWPFRIHATYGQSISRFLDVFEKIDREVPLRDLRWIIDHAETAGPRELERIRKLGGAIAFQNRMAFQGEYFVQRYGAEAAKDAPPIRLALDLGIPVGFGTDATRVSSYNPWVALAWLITGRTVGGLKLYDDLNKLNRYEALRGYTFGSAQLSREEHQKGAIVPGQLADFAVLTADYFTVPADEIAGIESTLTVVDGRVVYASGDFHRLAPPVLPASPSWSPQAEFPGYPSDLVGHPHVHDDGLSCFAI
jgi:predicted amidohydrolase YtcJ